MPTTLHPSAWLRSAAILGLCLGLTACGAPPQSPDQGADMGFGADSGAASGYRTRPGDGNLAGIPIGVPPLANPTVKRTMISRALREWEYFGRQTVVLKGAEESIPHVGIWEDDDGGHSGRINTYWRAVNKPDLNGMDCEKPWSAAFMSWVMQNSGVPEGQFVRSSAHWVYLVGMIEAANMPGRWFVPRRVRDYSPKPGDLVCAYRGRSSPASIGGYVSAWGLRGSNAHCDLVVAKTGESLDVVGGNVRNSVSKTTLELDGHGRLRQTPRRPWFMILENRL